MPSAVSTLGSGPAVPVPLEQMLVRRAAGGDGRAFRLIFEEQAPKVRRFLRDLMRDEAAADEATQETFVRAHGSLATLRERERLTPWLLGIARNVFRERRRQLQRQATPRAELDQVRAGGAPSPRDALLEREAGEMLQRALAGLDEHRRAAVVMRIDHDLSYDEIAALMGWSLAKVKNEIHRGRLALRAALRRYLSAEEVRS